MYAFQLFQLNSLVALLVGFLAQRALCAAALCQQLQSVGSSSCG
jgi:hypothetical protein